MKIKIIYILLAIFLVIFSPELKSKELPKSFLDSNFTLKAKTEVEYLVTNIPNIDSLVSISDSLYKVGINHPEFYGVAYDYNIKMKSEGTWDTLLNGDRVWRYHIICPSAKTVNVLLENVSISNNSDLSFYNESNESLLGPYNKRINNETKIFSSHLIKGQSVFIELYEPKEDFGLNELEIRKVIFGYIEN